MYRRAFDTSGLMLLLVSTIDLSMMRWGSAVQTNGLGLRCVAEIAVDRRLQVDERAQDTALHASARQRGEKAFDRIGPGARSRAEVEDPPRMPLEPGAHFGMLVDGVVVEDRVDELSPAPRPLSGSESGGFLVAVARHALADDGAVEDIERREQRGRAVADVIMGSSCRPDP